MEHILQPPGGHCLSSDNHPQTNSQMERLNQELETSSLRIPPPVVNILFGLSMHTIPYPAPPLACLSSSVLTVINLRCFPPWNVRSVSPQCSLWFAGVIGPGPGPVRSSYAASRPTRRWRITIGLQLHPTRAAGRCGYPPKTSRSELNPVSWLLASLIH